MKTKNVVKRQIHLLLAVSLLFMIRPAPIEAALVIEPALVKVELTQNRTSGSFVIRNTSDSEERYRAKTVHFMFTRDGGLIEIRPDEYSLAAWVKFNPKEFVLPPKSSRMVRFSVIPGRKLPPREFWGAIEFMPLKGAKVQTKGDKGQTIDLEILTVVLVPIYGFVNNTRYSGQIRQIDLKREKEKAYLYCDFVNTGDGILRLTGSCRIIDASGSMVDEIPLKSVVVFTKNDRLIKIELKNQLSKGSYVARVNLKSTDPHSKVELSGETKFNL